MNDLDQIDKRLLETLQFDFPLEKKPWIKIGEVLNLGEDEILKRLKRLSDRGIIRKIGPILNGRSVGFKSSTLVALKVEKNRINKVAQIVNKFDNVTHNYLRDHEFNMWFTITALDEKKLLKIIQEIQRRAGLKDDDILNLPTVRLFKINVCFDLK